MLGLNQLANSMESYVVSVELATPPNVVFERLMAPSEFGQWFGLFSTGRCLLGPEDAIRLDSQFHVSRPGFEGKYSQACGVTEFVPNRRAVIRSDAASGTGWADGSFETRTFVLEATDTHSTTLTLTVEHYGRWDTVLQVSFLILYPIAVPLLLAFNLALKPLASFRVRSRLRRLSDSPP